MGVIARWERWFELVFQAQLERDRVGVLDGFVVAQPFAAVELSVGYRRAPMFPTGRDAPVAELPLLERSTVVRAFWPERDVGAEARLLPRSIPVELIARIGNGNVSPLGNADDGFAAELRGDLVLGRAWNEPGAPFGLRVGLTFHGEQARDALGVAGQTSAGFFFFRPPPISGWRTILAPHAILYVGPLSIILEGAYARESRAVDDDGDPSTPRSPREATESWGVSAELDWALLGAGRALNEPLLGANEGALSGGAGRLDLSARVERLALGRLATDIPDGGAWVGSIGGRYWLEAQLGLGVALELYRFDEPPVDDLTGLDAFVVWARVTARIGAGV